MEGLEDGVTRPRQVRYQAALRPDCTHSTPLPDRVAPCFGPTVSKLLQSWGGAVSKLAACFWVSSNLICQPTWSLHFPVP
jgi:hypothetical protein